MKSEGYKEKSVSMNKIHEEIFVKTGIIHFPERLSEAMKKAGNLSNSGLAKKAGMSEAVIRKYLKGESYPTLDRASLLAVSLGCRIEWLVSGDGQDSHEGASQAISYDRFTAELLAVLARQNDDKKNDLLNVIYSKGLDQILALGNNEDSVLLSLPIEDKQRLIATQEAFEKAKKGAPEGSKVDIPQSPASDDKRQVS